MIATQDRTQHVEDLTRMMDELCAPELTLARSQVLRSRITRLLDTIRESNPPARSLARPGCPEAFSGR